jgi:hypothetical protein
MSGMSSALYAFGGAVFVLLGALHGLYTLLDLKRPRRLVPDDPAVMQAMAATGLRLTRGATDMWRAWIGFNLSHSLGVVCIGAAAVAWPALTAGASTVTAWLPALIGAVYLVVGLRYWFRIPTAGIAIATLSLASAAMLR